MTFIKSPGFINISQISGFSKFPNSKANLFLVKTVYVFTTFLANKKNFKCYSKAKLAERKKYEIT